MVGSSLGRSSLQTSPIAIGSRSFSRAGWPYSSAETKFHRFKSLVAQSPALRRAAEHLDCSECCRNSKTKSIEDSDTRPRLLPCDGETSCSAWTCLCCAYADAPWQGGHRAAAVSILSVSGNLVFYVQLYGEDVRMSQFFKFESQRNYLPCVFSFVHGHTCVNIGPRMQMALPVRVAVEAGSDLGGDRVQSHCRTGATFEHSLARSDASSQQGGSTVHEGAGFFGVFGDLYNTLATSPARINVLLARGAPLICEVSQS